MAKLLAGDELKQRASELGISTEGDPIFQSSMGRAPAPEHELQRRVIEAERAIREHRLWIVALVSAFASVVSAATAIIVVLARR